MKAIENTKVSEARQELAQDPKDSNAHYNLGLALMKSIEQPLRAMSLSSLESTIATEAETEFKKALTLSSNTHGRAAIMLGMLYQFQGQYAKGLPYAQMGLQLPADSRDYAIAADVTTVCLSETGKKDEALAVVQEALKHHPDNAQLQKYYQILASAQTQPSPASMDEKQKKAVEMGQQLQKEMEKIMSSGDPAEVQQKKMQKAQAEYQKQVQALYAQ